MVEETVFLSGMDFYLAQATKLEPIFHKSRWSLASTSPVQLSIGQHPRFHLESLCCEMRDKFQREIDLNFNTYLKQAEWARRLDGLKGVWKILHEIFNFY